MNSIERNRNIEIHYRLLKILSINNDITQRKLAHEMGISLGKVNYCLSELAKTGMIRIKRFKEAKNKSKYIYSLTPRGLEEKVVLTMRFLKGKQAEYEIIKRQIKELTSELEENSFKAVSQSTISFEGKTQ